MKKIGSIVLLGFLAILLGGLVCAVFAGFIRFLEWGQKFLWDVLTPNLPFQTLIVCTLGGLFVGLCQRYLGDHPKTLIESVVEIQKTKRLDYTHLPNGLVTVFVSLVFGASLGPESAIVNLLGGLGTWVGDAISTLRKWLNLPLSTIPSQDNKPLKKLLHNWPGLLALVVSSITLLIFLSRFYRDGFINLQEPFQWTDLFWSVPMGLLGVMGGSIFLVMQTWMKRWFGSIQQKPVLKGALSGFILGIIAHFLPMVLFSGQHQFQQAYEQATQLGFGVLLLTTLARFFLISLLLANGWKGGQFLPLMFSSTVLGLSITLVFPSVSIPAAIFGTMAALVTTVLPKPVIVLIVMAIFFPIQYLGISAVAVGVVMLGRRLWKKVIMQKVSKTKVYTSS